MCKYNANNLVGNLLLDPLDKIALMGHFFYKMALSFYAWSHI